MAELITTDSTSWAVMVALFISEDVNLPIHSSLPHMTSGICFVVLHLLASWYLDLLAVVVPRYLVQVAEDVEDGGILRCPNGRSLKRFV